MNESSSVKPALVLNSFGQFFIMSSEPDVNFFNNHRMLKTRLNQVLFIYSPNRHIFLFQNYQMPGQRFKSKLEMEN